MNKLTEKDLDDLEEMQEMFNEVDIPEDPNLIGVLSENENLILVSDEFIEFEKKAKK